MVRQQAPGRASWSRAAILSGLPMAVALTWILSAILAPTTLDDFVVIWGLSSTVTTLVGVLILWQRPGHRMGRLLVAVGLMFGISAALGLITTELDPFAMRFPRITPAITLLGTMLSSASLLVGSLFVIVRFPSGRRTSQLGLFIEVLTLGAIAAQIVADVAPQASDALATVSLVLVVLAYPLAAVDIALRYRRAAPIERAQFRWLIAAASVTGTLVVLMIVLGDRVEWLWSAWIASTILPTIAVGFAVLRYRLYDIDRIVSRSLTYGALTVVLFAVFFATNILLQNAISPLVDGNVIATAVSTLLVANLFQPVRRRVQAVVDRRFHRARYDADRTVDAFAGRLRDSIDLSRLVGDLRRTTDDAVEPTSTTVWLRGARP